MNKKLFDYIQTTSATKPFMDDVINRARSERVHVTFALGRALNTCGHQDLKKMLIECDCEEYIWPEMSEEWATTARRVLLDKIQKWFVGIGQDMREFTA